MSHGVELEGRAKALDLPTSGTLAPFAKWLARLNGVLMGVSMVAIVAAACILTGSVILRYFLKVPTDWQDEAAVFLLVGATFLCSAYVQSYRGHVGIEAIASILPASVNRVRLIFCDVVSFLFCAFFAWKSWTLFHEAWAEGQTTSSTWAPPLAIPYSLMASGMTLLALQLLLQVLRHFSGKENR
jgi:TRAP-type C4-dicarboxylate transport system permease small subunit